MTGVGAGVMTVGAIGVEGTTRRALGLTGATTAGDLARVGAGLAAGAARSGAVAGAARSVCGTGIACSSIMLGAACAGEATAGSLFRALCRAATSPPDASRQTAATAATTRFLEDNGRSCA